MRNDAVLLGLSEFSRLLSKYASCLEAYEKIKNNLIKTYNKTCSDNPDKLFLNTVLSLNNSQNKLKQTINRIADEVDCCYLKVYEYDNTRYAIEL